MQTRFVLIPLVVVLAVCGACGESKAPTAPTKSGGLNISDLKITVQGAPGDLTYKFSMRIAETSNRTSINITQIAMRLDERTSSMPFNSLRLAAGENGNTGELSFRDETGRGPASQFTVTMTWSDEAGNTGTATASAQVQVLVLVTLYGTISDRTTGLPLANATIRVTSSGPNQGTSARSDAAGRFSLAPLVAGAFTVLVDAAGYTSQTFPIDIATDAPFNPSLTRTPPLVEYTVTGTARTCQATYQSSSSGTSQATVTLPWSYTRTASTNDFLYVSCQINTSGDNGNITVRIYRQGTTVASAFASGFPNIATASSRY
jgi:Carboxypeptidase regulatory-like domain